MEDLKKLDHSTLVELLARHTDEYMRMFKNGSSQQEFEICRDLIDRIGIEIESRKQEKKDKT